MDLINVIKQCKGYSIMVELWSMGIEYSQGSEILKEAGYYVPKDQWDTLMKLIDIQVELDIGRRKGEGR